MSITGTATLGGTLQVGTASGFNPVLGSTFRALTGSSVSGTFSTVADSGIYSVAYNPTNVTLTTVKQTLPSVSIGNATVQAPAYGTAPAIFTVTLSAAQSAPVTVQYTTAAGTGMAGTDYQSAQGTLIFPAGQTTETVAVNAIGGTLGSDKTFFVDLSSPSGAVLGTVRGTGTITHPASSVGGTVRPSVGGDAGTVTVTIQGKGLFGTPTVALTASGKPAILATDVTVASDGSSLSATFDLSGAALGPRTVEVTEPGATSPETITGAFTVVPAVTPTVSAQIVGPPALGPNVAWSGELLYQNLGNIDAYGTEIQVSGFPEYTDVEVDGGDGLPVESDLGGTRTVSVSIDQIGALGSGEIPISFVVRGSVGSKAYLQVHVLQTSGSPSDAGDPNVSFSSTFTSFTNTETAGTLNVRWPGGSGGITFDIHPAAEPSDGKPEIRSSTADGEVTYSALVPPVPPPGTFPGSSSGCGRGVTAADPDLVRADASFSVGVAPVSISCNLPLAAAATARTARAQVPIARAAGLPWWIEDAKGAYDTWGKAQEARKLNAIHPLLQFALHVDNCLNNAGYFKTSYAKIERANALAQLNAAANLIQGAAVLPLAAQFAPGGVAGSLAADQAANWANNQAASSWGLAVASYLQQLGANDPDFNDPLGIYNPEDSLNQTLARIAAACSPCPTTGAPPAIFHAKDVGSGPGLRPRSAVVTRGTGEVRAADDGASCSRPPPPPDPPAFPITIATSHDPNDMLGPPGTGAVHWVSRVPRLPYTYTATFQNQATATAPAYQVRITDKVDASRLELATVNLGAVRFGSHVLIPPVGVQTWNTQVDLRPAKNAIVTITGALDRSTGVITWVFTTINATTGQPITDAVNGFLPPDKTPPHGDGSVSFTATPQPGLKSGAVTANQATIVFDNNAPIKTPTWVNKLDLSHPTSSVQRVKRITAVVPRTRHGHVSKHREAALIVTWTGRDRYSGVAAVDVYASRGGSRFTRVLHQTRYRRATFTCTLGRSYRFYTVAYSAVGNAQRGHSRPSAAVRCLRINVRRLSSVRVSRESSP